MKLYNTKILSICALVWIFYLLSNVVLQNPSSELTGALVTPPTDYIRIVPQEILSTPSPSSDTVFVSTTPSSTSNTDFVSTTSPSIISDKDVGCVLPIAPPDPFFRLNLTEDTLYTTHVGKENVTFHHFRWRVNVPEFSTLKDQHLTIECPNTAYYIVDSRSEYSYFPPENATVYEASIQISHEVVHCWCNFGNDTHPHYYRNWHWQNVVNQQLKDSIAHLHPNTETNDKKVSFT
eukprot:TRINITY_DN3141_c0_g1_i2.p1 TRINITY_DN3141_c0_g1~~TRINITY_DN3141_c0_g1_i2.p1  ORF type:complete len:235 (-),score=7.12 TRINITY_DN3141_c0_g1_i2:128-832(-)